MSTALANLKNEMNQVRHRASLARAAAKESTNEVVTDGVLALAAYGLRRLERSGKLPETVTIGGKDVRTTLLAGGAAKVAALMSRGKTRKYMNEGARAALILAGYQMGESD